MKYSFYYSGEKDKTTYRLFLERQFGVGGWKFETNIKAISNQPGITKLIGKEFYDFGGEYMLYPLDFKQVETGEYFLIEQHDKYLKIRFLGENTILQGDWIIRRLMGPNDNWIFWKPSAEVFALPTRNIADGNVEEDELVLNQKFSAFKLSTDGFEFEGIAAAEGIWLGMDNHTTLFTDDIIEEIGQQLISKKENLIIDYNHDQMNDAKIENIVIKEQSNMKYIEITGVGNKFIPLGSGLSLTLNSTLLWNNKVNAWVLTKVDVIGVSIITEGSPGCTICMIR